MKNIDQICRKNIFDSIKNSKSIIWDFDGVIKDSVHIKGEAFAHLFKDQSKTIKERICSHHKANGGISRYEKIKQYLEWSSYENNKETLNFFAHKFSRIVTQEVIDSYYIKGVHNFLKTNHKRRDFYLVTATPEEEIFEITKKLNIFDYFVKVLGYPKSKKNCFELILKESKHNKKDFLVIGDSLSEYQAAKLFKLKFILRIDTSINKIPEWYIEKDYTINNFISE